MNQKRAEAKADRKRIQRRNSILLVAGICLAALLMLGLYTWRALQVKEPMLEITVGNSIYGRYRLTEDQEIRINDTNVCEIRDGKVRMTKADCPDQICVHSAAIDRTGGSIICLPNRVVLHIVDADRDSGSTPDTVTG